ncbi:MAG: hypothetical protein JAZ17_04810 [Candidatus Thiodiazotropha endolucinida]|nr:hypothetical protein [Candidatus Thiodiazotropha endolucinida]
MKVVQSFFGSFLKTLFHPVVLISLFGPLILSVNLLSLRDALGFPYGQMGVTGDFLELKTVLNDAWAYALIDFNIQLYTLMLAWLVFYIEVFGLSLKLMRRYTVSRLKDVINDSTKSLVLATGIVLLFFGGIVVFFSGSLSGPDVVELYLPNGLNISGGIRIPPEESAISWFRLLILIFGIMLSLWEQRTLPKIMETPSA